MSQQPGMPLSKPPDVPRIRDSHADLWYPSHIRMRFLLNRQCHFTQPAAITNIVSLDSLSLDFVGWSRCAGEYYHARFQGVTELVKMIDAPQQGIPGITEHVPGWAFADGLTVPG